MKKTRFSILDPGIELTTEKDIATYLKAYLRKRGWYVIRNQQNIGSFPGIPDFTCVKDGSTIWVECKTPKWKPKPEDSKSKTEIAQDKFENEIISHGGIFVRVQSASQIHEIGEV